MVNWSQACADKRSLHLWQLQEANYGGCLFAVSALFCVQVIVLPRNAVVLFVRHRTRQLLLPV